MKVEIDQDDKTVECKSDTAVGYREVLFFDYGYTQARLFVERRRGGEMEKWLNWGCT